MIDGEAIVEVLGQIEAAILVREADGPVSAIRARDAANNSPAHFVHRGRDLAYFAIPFGDGEREPKRRELRARRP